MNIYFYELKRLRGSMMVWMLALSLISLMFLMIYPAFSQDVAASQKLLDTFPPVVRDMFGLSLAAFSTFLGYYAYTFTYLTLAAGVQAMNLGIGVMAHENQSKTTEFLLTKPITRRSVFIAKLSAALTVVLATWLVFCLVTFIMANFLGTGSFDIEKFMIFNLFFLIIQLWFVTLGLLVSQIIGKIRSVISLSIAFTFGFFIIGLIGSIIGDDKVRFITPFKFVDYMNFVAKSTIDAKYLIVGCLIMLIMLSTSYIIFTRRDARVAG